ncbi:gluconokinase [Caulobacter sp. KR2-114]|uniref:gluconokinase n=1 Tax=Caulobacter sp. KR2-114 TaxID=3400912 RepID=UPI003C0F32C1
MASRPRVLVMMGVAGAGKSTVGRLAADRLGWPFVEGDDLHPPANVARMAAGEPLTDADRAPWLQAVAAQIDAWIAAGQGGVITCSALKRAYRDRLRRPGVLFVFLAAAPDEVSRRLEARRGHFMPATLAGSQFATLEPPGADEAVLTLGKGTPERLARAVAEAVGGP